MDITPQLQPNTAPLPQSPKGGPEKTTPLVITIVLGVIVIAAVVFSLYVWQKNEALKASLAQKDSQLATLGSKNSVLQSSLDKKSVAQSGEETDQAAAQKAAQAYVDAQILDQKYIATLGKIEDSFATANVSPSNDSRAIVLGLTLKKSDGIWIVIHQGQNGPGSDIISRFGIPKDL